MHINAFAFDQQSRPALMLLTPGRPTSRRRIVKRIRINCPNTQNFARRATVVGPASAHQSGTALLIEGNRRWICMQPMES